ncbi:MAG: DUF2029 domain-containing protein [Candidatus Krumholzibacteriota bacterium]|nr:DUF2029 domain-containing protein [Candidatus Krumholzibacteriota bacterium]
MPLLIIFFALYVPFLLKYGWGYRHTPNADLPTFHAASVTVFEQGKSPYDHENLRRLRGDRVPPFLYPPPSLLFFFPLSGLTYPTARQLILFLNHLLFLILVWAIPLYLLRAEPGQGFAVFAVCFVYSLTSDPVAVTLNYGQVNILFLAFLVIFWLLARRRNAILAALFLALAILLKTYPLILIPLLLLIGRWRESVYTVACLGLALIASLMILPNVVWHDWLTNILPTGGYTRIFAGLIPPAATWNQSLNGFFARAFTESKWSNPLLANPDLARFLTYTFAGLALVATGLAAWRSFRIHADSLDRTILAALPLMYLLAPLSWVHHIVYLLPSMLMLLNSRSSFGAVPKFMFYTLCVGSAVLLGIPYMPQFKFYGVAVLWGLALFTACSRAIELPNKSLGRNEDYPLARQG